MRNKSATKKPTMVWKSGKSLAVLGFAWLLIIMLVTEMGEGARGGGGGGRRGGGRKGTKYGMRMPILIRPRNQEAGSYYEHKDGARIIKSSHFELDYMLGRKITFFCMAKGLPRPEITWFKDGIELYAHKFFQGSFFSLPFPATPRVRQKGAEKSKIKDARGGAEERSGKVEKKRKNGHDNCQRFKKAENEGKKKKLE